MKKVLFVCVENSNRSQMAEAFAHIHGGKDIEAYSAGSKPSGAINPKAVAAMHELGYNLSLHQSKSLDEIPDVTYDAVVTMGCGDACPWIAAHQRADWDLPDPKAMDTDEFRKIRNQIEKNVVELLAQLKDE
jgi:arsenate reductase